MDSTKYLQGLDALTKHNRILGIGLVCMFLWNIYNMTTIRSAQTHQQVAVVPVAGGADMWVGGGKASQQYLRAMGRMIVGAVGNYQAASIRSQLMELLILFPPDRVGAAQVEFTRLADDIERYPSIASVIHLSGADPIKYTDTMLQVRVLKDRLVNGSQTESKQSHYCISYRVEETRFWVLNILEKEGTGEDLCLFDSAKPTT
jgi:TraE protein